MDENNNTAGQSFANYDGDTIITGTEGDDTIFNAGYNVSIDAGAGNDYVYNEHAYYPTIEGGDGSDTIVVNRGHYSYIDGGAGADSILGDDSNGWAMGGYATINGGDGDDYINPIASDSASINGGAGNDTIITSGNDATINGGDGDDIISLDGASIDNNVIQFESGNDTIYGFNETSAISIAAGTEYSTAVSGDDVILTVGENKITIAGGASLSAINVIDYELTALNVDNTVDNTLITGSALDDTIKNSGSNVTINGAAGADSISNEGSNVTIDGAEGDDSFVNHGDNVSIGGGYGNDIFSNSGKNATIDAGAGRNLVNVENGEGSVIFLDGDTTVEGFNTGFGDGTDTIYITGDPAGVEIKSTGLTFANSTDSLTMSDVTTTAKINIYHEQRSVLNKGVFIAGNDWYSVEDSDLSVNSGEELYFVGTSATQNHGVDFSGVTQSLNVTMDTAYIDSEDYVAGTSMWINSVYSLRGGAGDTTITGSKLSDTIIAGTGATTINGSDGDDFISLGSAQALVEYTDGDGDDTIEGFNENSALKISGADFSTTASGNDVIVTVGDSKITLLNAANLESLNIESDTENPLVTIAEMVLKRTEAGYPVMAGIAFHPTVYHGDEPTNYAAKENWTIESADGLELSGVHYTPEDSNDKWVVIVHGYGHNHKHMYPYATSYLANGYNVLMIDQRAAGDSEGEWLTMGAAESQDVALWTQEIARRNSNAKITLHGVSMGSATVMLAASRSDITNVTSLVEDCGYSDVMEIFYALNEVYIQQPREVIAAMDAVAAGLTGHYLSEAAPINSISAAKMPTLFITGDADTVVPVSMLTSLYDESGAEVKEKFIVEGATHGIAALADSIGYANTVFRFNAEADGEGWATDSTTDAISLRGTKYNDTISSSGDNVTIDTGAGVDYISNTGSNVTIDTGAGDDFVLLSSNSSNNVINYTAGDGFDSILGLKEGDSLRIGDGTGTYSTVASGDDVIVKVGDGSITLKNARNKPSTLIIGESSSSGGGSGDSGGGGGNGGGSGGSDYDFEDEETITIAGGGNSSIDLSDSDYDVAYIGEDALGTKNITLGGDNTVVVEDSGAKVNITASKGNDTIISNSDKIFVSLRGGNTEIYAPSGKVTVAGYNPATGSGFRTDYDDILAAADANEILLDDGELTIGAAVITVTNSNNIFNLYDADGDLQKFGYAIQDGSLNLSKEKSNMVLVAGENATLTAGTGNDTVYAFEGSHVDGGAGRNYIEMDERPENGKGVEVALTNGKNTIGYFNNGFDHESDRLFAGVNDEVDFKFDGTDLKVKVNNVTRGVVTDIADGAPFVNFLMADANSTSKIVAIQKGETVTVEDEVADYYRGNKSGVDFSNYDETLAINLGSQEQSIGTGEVLFSGINQITVGGGLNTLIGSSANETLTGNSDGITEFGFGAGGGRDVISNFNFDEDKINVSDAVTGVRIIGEGNVRLQVGDGSDFLTIENAQGEHFNINGFTAKVDSNIDFDDTANYFVATSRNATLTVGDDVEGDAIIWLDNPDRNGSVFKGDIRTLDASNATVKTELAGNDLDNVILAGEGDASLWGGNGGDDLLVGGAGENIFFYTNGNDVISNVNDGDKIILSGIALEQITGTDFTDSAVAVKFSDGGTLTVNEAGKAVDFVVGEQTFVVNDEHSGFDLK